MQRIKRMPRLVRMRPDQTRPDSLGPGGRRVVMMLWVAGTGWLGVKSTGRRATQASYLTKWKVQYGRATVNVQLESLSSLARSDSHCLS